MNIFVLDVDPITAAKNLCDKHVPKMIVESAQLLSTTHRLADGQQYLEQTAKGRNIKRWRLADPTAEAIVYKACFINHPCAAWARNNSRNYYWLTTHARHMCAEFTARFGKQHKCETLIDWFCGNSPKNISYQVGDYDFAMAMPDEFKDPSSVVDSYRNYYAHAKSRFARWKDPTERMPLWYFMICKERGIPILDDSPELEESMSLKYGIDLPLLKGFNKP